jgi:hypothetical protein
MNFQDGAAVLAVVLPLNKSVVQSLPFRHGRQLRKIYMGAHRSTMLRPELAGTHFFFSYDQQTGFRLPLVSALLGLPVLE